MSDQAQHTPGPWSLWLSRKRGAFFEAIIRSDKRGQEQDVAAAFGATKEQAEANAHLIAAAPDCLSALKAVKRTLDELNDGDGPDSGSNLEADLFQVNAAIARAEGRA